MGGVVDQNLRYRTFLVYEPLPHTTTQLFFLRLYADLSERHVQVTGLQLLRLPK